MRAFGLFVLPLLVLASSPLLAADKGITAEQQAQIDAALENGGQIYRYDQAAWHTTDAMLEDLAKDDLNAVRGWVIMPDENGLRATYYRRDESGAKGLYSAVWTGSAVVDRHILSKAAETALSPDQLALIAAQDAARASAAKDKLMLCSARPFNTVTLPGKTAETPISVYLLTPQTENGVFPMGGHHLLQYQNGKEVKRRSFSKGCLNMSTQQPPSAPKGKTMALFVTSLLDPVPSEIHVFTANTANLPIAVGTTTNKMAWMVAFRDGKMAINLLADRTGKAK